MSRIYDLEPVPPVHYEDEAGHAKSLEPEHYFDA